MLLKAKNLTKWQKGPLTSWLLLLLLLPFRKFDSETIKAAHITKALATTQSIFKQKDPDWGHRMCFCYRMTTQSTLPPQSRSFNGDESVKTISQPPYSQNITTVDIFLFRRVKSELADLLLSQKSFSTSLEGVIRTISKNDSTTVIRRWINHFKM
jgi:hypothetical protein